MNYDLSCRIEYVVEQPNTFLFNLSVDRNECETVLEEHLHFEPELVCEELPTHGGLLHRVRAPEGALTVLYTIRGRHTPASQPSLGIGEVPSVELPAHVLEYVYPSMYCESNLLIGTAVEEFGSLERGYGRVLAICCWIHGRLRYESGSSDPNTSALQTLSAGSGVCSDYAHLGI